MNVIYESFRSRITILFAAVVLLTNKNGILLTSVYYKPTAEPYVAPFISDHPRHVFGNIIQTALTRAVRYSSTFEAFNDERRYIKLMLLYNGYLSTFIDNQFQKFFFEYISSSTSPFLPFITDEKQFFLMRHKIIDQPTPRKSQVAMSAAAANIDNDPTDEEQDESKESSIKKTGKKETNYGDKLFVHYTHEKRFHSFKRDMHQVYDNVFKNTNAIDFKLIVGNRNRRVEMIFHVYPDSLHKMKENIFNYKIECHRFPCFSLHSL